MRYAPRSFIYFIILSNLLPLIVKAQAPIDVVDEDYFAQSGNSSFFGISTSGSALGSIVLRVIEIILIIATFLALAYLIINGIKMMTAGGDEQKITEAKAGLVWVIGGMVVIGLTFAIIYASKNLAQFQY